LLERRYAERHRPPDPNLAVDQRSTYYAENERSPSKARAVRQLFPDGVLAVTGDATRKLSYGELLGGRYFDLAMTWNGKIGNELVAVGQAKPNPPSAYKIVGQSPPRFDAPAKVFGKIDYVTDIKVPGMLQDFVRLPRLGNG
jgi:hypothetical protein